MSGPMTPTEQDKELRELVHIVQNADTTYDAMQFIKADRKRVELEARLDERQMLSFHRAYGRDYQATLETLEEANDDRIAELKAQQEEVK